MASSSRAFTLSHFLSPTTKPHLQSLSSSFLLHPNPNPSPNQNLILSSSRNSSTSSAIRCLNGGISDEFVSVRKSSLDRGFSAIANLLKRIEPLDNSVISQGVSDSSKGSMKQTISTMLGLLPSDQFDVSVRVSRVPLHRLLVSSIITGYTLWNAEYRISLMRNFDILSNSSKGVDSSEGDKALEEESKEIVEVMYDVSLEDLDIRNLEVLGDLSPQALIYIQQLQTELHTVQEELKAQKRENMQIQSDRENGNGLLDYLRSLDSDMVCELSRPSSSEVEEIIQQLVCNILHKFFNYNSSSNLMGDVAVQGAKEHPQYKYKDDMCDTISTSRDYLAKLLFWCMLIGHHLRGLENRLHLSCVVGLL